MQDDFNTALALGHLFDLSRVVNKALDDAERAGGGAAQAEAAAAAHRLYALGGILGLFWKAPAGEAW